MTNFAGVTSATFMTRSLIATRVRTDSGRSRTTPSTGDLSVCNSMFAFAVARALRAISRFFSSSSNLATRWALNDSSWLQTVLT